MTDHPTDEIVEILRRHYFISSWDGEGCGCNSWRGTLFDWYAHLAEVLVSELGLRRELATVKQGHDGLWWKFWQPSKPYPFGIRPGFRYVTDWDADETLTEGR